MAKLKIKKSTIARKDNEEAALPAHVSKLVKITGKRNNTAINDRKDEYYLASMFPNDDVMLLYITESDTCISVKGHAGYVWTNDQHRCSVCTDIITALIK